MCCGRFIFRATIARSVVRPLLCALALNVVRGRVFSCCFGLNVNERCTGHDRFNRGGERQTHTMKTEHWIFCRHCGEENKIIIIDIRNPMNKYCGHDVLVRKAG